MTRFLLVVFVAFSLNLGGMGTVSAQGNSEAAHACKNGGWKELLRARDTGFRNQGDCVSFAAQGGTFWVPSGPAITIELGAPQTIGEFSVAITGNGLTSYTSPESLLFHVGVWGGGGHLRGIGAPANAEPDGTLNLTIESEGLTCSPQFRVIPDQLRVRVFERRSGNTLASATFPLDCASGTWIHLPSKIG